MNTFWSRTALGVFCLIGLLVIFVFQDIRFVQNMLPEEKPVVQFIINRTIRFLLNDILALGLIFSLFPYRKYLIFSLLVQVAGVVLFLIPYFILKLNYPSYNGPLISYLHRLIFNPVFLLLLIPAFYHQRITRTGDS